MNITDLISIRPLERDDVNFVLDSSMQCLAKYTESIFKGMNRSDIYHYLETVTLHALQSHRYSVFIACHREDSHNIIGYIVADSKDNHVMFQYTKYSYRKLGIQKHILMPLVVDEAQPVSVNWPTKEMLKLAKLSRVSIIDKHKLNLIEDAS